MHWFLYAFAAWQALFHPSEDCTCRIEGVLCPIHPAAADPVNHPPHYTNHPSGVECITVAEWFPFNVGNAIKYLWRAGEKGDAILDLEKARWYVDREIQRLRGDAR